MLSEEQKAYIAQETAKASAKLKQEVEDTKNSYELALRAKQAEINEARDEISRLRNENVTGRGQIKQQDTRMRESRGPTREDLAPFANAKIDITPLGEIVEAVAATEGLTLDEYSKREAEKVKNANAD